MGQGPGGQVVGQFLDIVAPAPGVGDPGRAAFHLQEQLGVAADAGGEIRWQGKGFVQTVGVQALGLAIDRRHGLDTGPGHVVVDILGGQGPAGRLAVGAQGQGAAVLGIELPLHQPGPEQAGGAHLGHFHEVVHADGPEEAEPGRKLVDGHAGGDTGPGIFDAVGKGIGQFQVGGRAGLLHVIAGDRDGIELRHLRRSI